MSVVLMVVDSLRSDFTDVRDAVEASRRKPVSFRRAYSTECWTLPSHLSMFTGLLPSEHGAHFQSMAYAGKAPTIAEVLRERGYACEAITRNFVFDGAIPGVCRGFERVRRPLSRRMPGAVELFLAAAKPRFRRHLHHTGFFHPQHRANARFLRDFAAALLPADDEALALALAAIAEQRERRRPHFLFVNLYDVHAPYPPSPASVLRPWTSLAGIAENLTMPIALAHLGEHRYLREGFSLGEKNRQRLIARYGDAVRLTANRLSGFLAELNAMGVFDDTLVILTSDHGEGFGEHGLYLHDASVYETHLRVPLWIWHPAVAASEVNDVVSLRHLHPLMRAAGCDGGAVRGSILEPSFRLRNPCARAEHIDYPHAANARPEVRGRQTAIIGRRHKLVARDNGEAYVFDLVTDPNENERLPVGGDALAMEAQRDAA